MVVLFMMLVMARPRIEIVFRRGAKPQHHARIDPAFGDFKHRNIARRFGQNRLARGGEAIRIDQIGLVEDHDVGAGDLVLEHFAERRVVIDALVGKALPRDGREIGREPAVGDSFGVGDRNHAIDRDAGSQIRPFERFQQRLWQREAGGFDQDMVGRMRPRQQRRDGRHEIIGDGAAQAAIGEFDDGVFWTIGVGAAFQNVAVDAEVAEFIDQYCEPAALRVLHQVTNQRGFAGAEETGDDGDGDFFDRHLKFRTGLADGGMRAITPLRKIVGRSRHGTSPSAVAA